MKLFNLQSTKQYKAAIARYTGDKAASDYQAYCDTLANCVNNYMESQDSSHLDKLLDMSRFRNMYRVIKPFADDISAYRWSQSKGYYGKMNKGKMQAIRNLNDDDVLVWEQRLFDMLASVSAKQAERDTVTTEPMTYEQGSKKVQTLFAKLYDDGFSIDDILAMVYDANEIAESKKAA